MNYCPVCLSVDSFHYSDARNSILGDIRHNCDLCGIFVTTEEARDDFLYFDSPQTSKLVRATLSHWTRSRQERLLRSDIPVVTIELIEAIITGEINLPNPAEQARNIIRFIGDATEGTGEGLATLEPKFHAIVGSISREFAFRVFLELVDLGLVSAIDSSDSDGFDAMDVWLTLNGWKSYEDEQKGKLSGNYGFIALKFGDDVLDAFLKEHIRPAIKTIGMDLRDLRDVSRTGVIDNLMREQIRDAAFVLADLTHDNSGAYWEAGYAEGLGKPVLYICEKSKFETAKTHFDVNHCTTVMWDIDNPGEFSSNLIATIRRSLNI